MGGSSPWTGATLPAEITSYTTYNMSSRGPAFAQTILKDAAIDYTLNGVADSVETFMGTRLTTPLQMQDGKVEDGTGYIANVSTDGTITGSGTLFTDELLPGDTLICHDDASPPDFAVFTIVEVFSDTLALGVSNLDSAWGVKTGGSFRILRRSLYSLPFLRNPDVYMTDDDINGAAMLASMELLANTSIESGALTNMSPMFFSGGDLTFSETLTEEQMGIEKFANLSAAKDELQKSIIAAEKGIAAADEFLQRVSTLDAETAIQTWVQPLVDRLVAQKNADKQAIQRGYSIANGFFNTNILDRLAEIDNKYAVQIAALEVEAAMRLWQSFSQQAVQCIDALLRFQNGPLRDRILAQELRLKAMEVGARVLHEADNSIYRRWGFMYSAATDAVKRDYANDMTMWGAREDLMRFSAELQQAYLGTVNAGLGKGVDAMGVTKQVLGMGIAVAGTAAAFMTPAGGDVARAGADMAGMKE